MTPFDRLKACGQVSAGTLAQLEDYRATLNPFALKRTIEKKLRKVLRAAKSTALKLAA